MKATAKCAYLLALAVGLMPAGTTAQPAASGPPIEIDTILAMTGPAAFNGKSQSQGLQVVENYINRTGGIQGRPVKIVIADTQSSPQVDVQLVSGLLTKRITVMIDGAPSALCNASIPMLEKTGPVEFCLSPVIDPPPGSFAFAAGPVASSYATTTVRYLRERGFKRIAMINATDASGLTNGRMTVATLQLPENKGVELVANESFSPTDVSVAAQIAKIKSLNPEALIAYTTGPPTATVLRAMKDSGLDIPVLGSAANMSVEQLNSYASFVPKELSFAAPLATAPANRGRGEIDAAVARFRDAFAAINVHPDIGMLQPWDPMLLFVDALRKLGVDASAAQIRDYIARQRGWTGAMGRYDFVTYPQRGLGDESLIIARWDPARSEFTRASKPGGAL